MASPSRKYLSDTQKVDNVYGMNPDTYHAVFVVPDEYAEEALVEIERLIYDRAGNAAVDELRAFARRFVERSQGGAHA